MPPNILPNAPQIIKSINTNVENSKLKPLSVSNGTKCIIGTDMQTQQKMTAKLIHATTAFSVRGKFLSSLIASERASTLQGDSLINSEIGKEIEI